MSLDIAQTLTTKFWKVLYDMSGPKERCGFLCATQLYKATRGQRVGLRMTDVCWPEATTEGAPVVPSEKL
jgi:hypothetical protein